MGVSPKEYLIDFRIRNARRLLLNTGMTVTEVAAAVGYNDGVNFSKIFKQRVGCSPGSFRKVHIHNDIKTEDF
jgi:AraC-like DNA-binding protein